MKTTIAIALLLTSVLLASCDNGDKAGTPAEPASQTDGPPPVPAPEPTAITADYDPVDNPTWGRAIVTGQQQHLIEFETKFRQVSGLNDADAMAEKQIGCTRGCDGLPVETPPMLEYIFPREYPNILSIFGQAWDAVQKEQGDADFSLSFNAAIPTRDCEDEPQQPCDYMPYCPGDRCGYAPPTLGKCNRC